MKKRLKTGQTGQTGQKPTLFPIRAHFLFLRQRTLIMMTVQIQPGRLMSQFDDVITFHGHSSGTRIGGGDWVRARDDPITVRVVGFRGSGDL